MAMAMVMAMSLAMAMAVGGRPTAIGRRLAGVSSAARGGSEFTVTDTGPSFTDVPSLLAGLGLSAFVLLFEEEGLDLDALRLCEPADLMSIGVPLGPRKKIFNALGCLTRGGGLARNAQGRKGSV